jgi:chemotaxis protein histidine kinase CheA
MPKSEALKIAQVSAFDAKRYLSSFSEFVPSDRFLMQGGMVSWRVPGILSNFKKMEEGGLSLEQIEQEIAKNLAQGRQPGAGPAAKPESPSIQVAANRLESLLALMQQVVENQANMYGEILKLIQLFEGELIALDTRIAKLEETAAGIGDISCAQSKNTERR